MKIISAIFGLLVFLFPWYSLAQQVPTSTIEKKQVALFKHTTSTNPIFLFLGMANIGYEQRLGQHIAVEGHIGFNKLWFTELDHFYEIGMRYYINKNSNKSRFIKATISGIALHTKEKRADILSYGMFIGKRWLFGNNITFDLSGGAYFSGDDKVKFEKIEGNTTKTLDIGGPVRFSGNLLLGISF